MNKNRPDILLWQELLKPGTTVILIKITVDILLSLPLDCLFLYFMTYR